MSNVRFRFIYLLFIILLAGSSVTASFALMPGCAAGKKGNTGNIGAWSVMEAHANALRVRDKAYTREILKLNDNALGMTCFDHALTVTSRLGMIFSDNIPTWQIPAENSSAFGVSAYPGYGSQDWLLWALAHVNDDIMEFHADDFVDSLSRALGATLLRYLDPTSLIMGALNGILSSITSAISQLSSYVSQLSQLVDILKDVLDLLGITMPSLLTAVLEAVNAAWGAIRSFISSVIQAFMQAVITPLIQAIKGLISGAAGSMAAFSGPEGECSRIARLWGNDSDDWGITDPETGQKLFEPIEGAGVEDGTPYFDYAELLTKNPGGVGPDLLDEINNAANDDIFAMARLLVMNPGTTLGWAPTPVFPPGISSDELIMMMNLPAAPPP